MYHVSHTELLSNDSVDVGLLGTVERSKKERATEDWAPQRCLEAGNSQAKAASMGRAGV